MAGLPDTKTTDALYKKGVISDDLYKRLRERAAKEDVLSSLVPDDLLDALGAQESEGERDRDHATSSAGARGRYQLMPATAEEVGRKLGIEGDLDLSDPALNRRLAKYYLGEQMDRFKKADLALAAYNGGPARVQSAIDQAGSEDWGAVSKYLPEQTRNYAPGVLNRLNPTPPVPAEQPIDTSAISAASDGEIMPQRGALVGGTMGTAGAPGMAAMPGAVAGGMGLADPTLTSPPSPESGGAVQLPPPEELVAPEAQSPGAPIKSASLPGASEAATASPQAPGSRFDEAIGMQQDAAVKGAAAEMEQQTANAKILEKAVEERDAQIGKLGEIEARRQKAIGEQQAKIQSATDDLADEKIDSNRLWKNMSTGQKIVAAISIALSGVGEALTARSGGKTTGRNGALDIIMGAVKRDIEEQHANIILKQGTVASARGILQDTRTRFDDERQAEVAAHLIAVQRVQLQVQKQTAVYQNKEAEARGQMLYGQLEQEKQRLQMTMEQLALNSPAAGMTRREGVLAGKLPAAVLPKEERELYVPGVGMAATADDAKKVKESHEQWKGLEGLIDDMIKDRKEYGAEVYNRDVVARQKARAAATLLKIKNLEALGALDRGAVEIGQQLVPQDPTKMTFGVKGDTVVSQLTQLKEQFGQQYQQTLDTRIVERAPALMGRPGFAGGQ